MDLAGEKMDLAEKHPTCKEKEKSMEINTVTDFASRTEAEWHEKPY